METSRGVSMQHGQETSACLLVLLLTSGCHLKTTIPWVGELQPGNSSPAGLSRRVFSAWEGCCPLLPAATSILIFATVLALPLFSWKPRVLTTEDWDGVLGKIMCLGLFYFSRDGVFRQTLIWSKACARAKTLEAVLTQITKWWKWLCTSSFVGFPG